MERLRITGGIPLRGTVAIEGAKNAVLPLMAAMILHENPCALTRVPRVADVQAMGAILEHVGVSTDFAELPLGRLSFCSSSTLRSEVPRALAQKLRASILVLAPLLAQVGRARVPLPGGCAIGARPIDLHLKVLQSLGARITQTGDWVEAQVPSSGLQGAKISLPFPSVGATETALLAASVCRGETVLSSAAREPEVVALCHFLQACGVEIDGVGTATLQIQGRDGLLPLQESSQESWEVIPDRIEAGSYAIAAAITQGDILLEGVQETFLTEPLGVLRQMGVEVASSAQGLRISCPGGPASLSGAEIETAPYPGFPTDLQAQFLSLLTLVPGVSVVREKIFENRFHHVFPLRRMGADISLDGAQAGIRGVTALHGASVEASDLRASMGLVLAALAAQGETQISHLHHLDRGYVDIARKLQDIGAHATRIPTPSSSEQKKKDFLSSLSLSPNAQVFSRHG